MSQGECIDLKKHQNTNPLYLWVVILLLAPFCVLLISNGNFLAYIVTLFLIGGYMLAKVRKAEAYMKKIKGLISDILTDLNDFIDVKTYYHKRQLLDTYLSTAEKMQVWSSRKYRLSESSSVIMEKVRCQESKAVHVSIDVTTAYYKRRIAQLMQTHSNDFMQEIDNLKSKMSKENYAYAVEQYEQLKKFESSLNADGDTQKKSFDELLPDAFTICLEVGQVSVSMLQRRLKVGYERAAQIVEQMEYLGLVTQFNGSSPRRILTTHFDWDAIKFSNEAHSKNEPKALPIIEKVIEEEDNWRMQQQGIGRIEYELQKADKMSGRDFEHWCAGILLRNGFRHVEVTQGSGDQGVDVLAEKEGIKYAIQCKCYSSDLGNTPVQEVNTGKTIYHCHVGVVMTNQHFTGGAKTAAEATGILLWDREKLSEMLN